MLTLSAIFYLQFGKESIIVMLISILLNLSFVFLIKKYHKRFIVITGIIFNIIILLFFKYSWAIPVNNIFLPNYFFPVGISFYTFQQISFLMYCYNECTDFNIVQYLVFILFFPKVVSGPLVEPHEFKQSLADKCNLNFSNIIEGTKLFVIGLAKKVLIADVCKRGVDYGYSNLYTASRFELILTLVLYSFEIYYDFSGYTDMARGVAKMINIDLPENFNLPYRAISIVDFWKRWHISLTKFFTKYIYYPLGGNRKGKYRTYINIFIVFFVSGMWHGSNALFVIWGVIHGLLSIFDRVFKGFLDRIPKIIRWVLCFSIISILWSLFRAENLNQWLDLMQHIFVTNHNPTTLSDAMVSSIIAPWYVNISSYIVSIIRVALLFMFICISIILSLVKVEGMWFLSKNKTISAVVLGTLLGICLIMIGKESVFVYSSF